MTSFPLEGIGATVAVAVIVTGIVTVTVTHSDSDSDAVRWIWVVHFWHWLTQVNLDVRAVKWVVVVCVNFPLVWCSRLIWLLASVRFWVHVNWSFIITVCLCSCFVTSLIFLWWFVRTAPVWQPPLLRGFCCWMDWLCYREYHHIQTVHQRTRVVIWDHSISSMSRHVFHLRLPLPSVQWTSVQDSLSEVSKHCCLFQWTSVQDSLSEVSRHCCVFQWTSVQASLSEVSRHCCVFVCQWVLLRGISDIDPAWGIGPT